MSSDTSSLALIRRASWHCLAWEHLSDSGTGIWQAYIFWSFHQDIHRSVLHPDLIPALTSTLRMTNDILILELLSTWRLPHHLPPAVRPWLEHLRAAWEHHRQTTWPRRRTAALAFLIHLDSRGDAPQRLPEWLTEARSGLHLKNNPERKLRLAALAAWRPSRNPACPPARDLARWIAFWDGLYRETAPPGRTAPEAVPVRLIATQALLNLMECGVELPGHTPATLLTDFAAQLHQSLNLAVPPDECCLLRVWVPGADSPFPAQNLREIAIIWLEHATRDSGFTGFSPQTACQTLLDWQMTGLLRRCGLDLTPHLAAAVERELSYPALNLLAGWLLRPDGTEPSPALLSAFTSHWPLLCHSPEPWDRAAGWEIRRHLSLGHHLSPEEERRFREDALTAVLHEEETVLRSLSRCTPPAGCPASGGAWQHAWLERLADTNEDIAMLSSLVLWNFRVELAEKTATPAGVRPFRRALREAWQGLAASGVPSRDHLPDTRRWGQIVEALAAGQEPPSPFSQSPPLHLSRLPKAVSLSFRPGSSPPRVLPPGKSSPRLPVLPFPEKGLPPFR